MNATITITLKHEHALRLLEDLEQMNIISINDAPETEPLTSHSVPSTERTFTAFSFPTKGWKFNREEANER